MVHHYIDPRRFARVWEFDRNGPPACGTIEQQSMVRAVFDHHLKYGSGFDAAMWELDKHANSQGWSFYVFSFIKDPYIKLWARSWDTLIQMFQWPEDPPTPEYTELMVLHEVGHIVGKNLLTPRDDSEAYAEEFRIWVMNGSPKNSPTFERIQSK